jgi:lipid-A-disaccharide synthase
VRHDPSGPVLLLPGSRPKAVGLILPALLAGFREFSRGTPGRGAVVLYPGDALRRQLESLGLGPDVTLMRAGAACVGARAVLTSSGTMSMHCALAGIPGAIAYRTDPLTYLVARRIVRVAHLGIANIILGEPMYPEFIQADASAGALAAQLAACEDDPSRRERTAAQSAALRAMLVNPSGIDEAGWLAASLG